MERNEQIVSLKNKLHKIETTKEYLEKLQTFLDENEEKLAQAKEVYEKEHQDVEKLKHMSLTSILASLRHDKEEQMAKEEQEEIQAAFALKQRQADQESFAREVQRCLEEVKEEESLRKQLEEYLYVRATSDESIAEEVKYFRNQLEQIDQEEKELNEAIEVGNQVYDKVKLALDDLSDASTWGTIDILGGGILSTMIKHNNLNNAQSRIAEIRSDLLRFEKELKDVQSYTLKDAEISFGIGFADYAFDNIFTDFLVQSKIKETQQSVLLLHDGIDEILIKLLRDRARCEEQSKQVLMKYEELLKNQEVV